VSALRPARLTAGPQRRQPGPGLDAKVAFLREPSSYPGHPFQVQALETHMSWVFLADRDVYKLKKPVRYELLDFRTVQARHHFCAAEVVLNRRLAPDVYLGLAPLTCDRRAHLGIDRHGRVVDWLVHMRRLPAERMLDYALVHGALAEGDLERLARRLVAFYSALPAEACECAAYRERFRRNIEANRRALGSPVFELPAGHVRTLATAQLAMLERIGSQLDERVQGGYIVEGHGDLRPEHVCLCEPIAIIDCLEFARPLRIVDVADELGFLALECERLDAASAARELLDWYCRLSGESPPSPLLHFYQSCRATSRALITARHLLDERFRHSPHWLRRAGRYLQLAEEHILQAAA
jgi:aminoglycoside phosphotransferase family enzyme